MLLECSLACPPVAARGQEGIEYAAGMQSGLSTCVAAGGQEGIEYAAGMQSGWSTCGSQRARGD